MFRTAGTPVSKTDVLLFEQLANPDRVAIPDDTNKLMETLQVSGVRGTSMGRPSVSARPPPPQPQHPTPSPFDQVTRQRYNAAQQQQYHQPSSRRSTWHDSDSRSSGDMDSFMSRSDTGSFGGGPDSVGISSNRFGANFSIEGSDNGSFRGMSPTPPLASSGGFSMPEPIYDERVDTLQRQMYIQELRQYQAAGQTLSIDIHDGTPTMTLKSECDLIRERLDSDQGVSNLMMGLQIVMTLIELGNRVLLREALPISGWTQHTFQTNKAQFEQPLRRIHSLYFRNAFSSPFMQLGMVLLMSAGSYILMKRPDIMMNLVGGVASSAAPQPPMMSTPVPQYQPPPAPQSVPRGGPSVPPRRSFNPPAGTKIDAPGRFPAF